jgi:hypothetical protein
MLAKCINLSVSGPNRLSERSGRANDGDVVLGSGDVRAGRISGRAGLEPWAHREGGSRGAPRRTSGWRTPRPGHTIGPLPHASPRTGKAVDTEGEPADATCSRRAGGSFLGWLARQPLRSGWLLHVPAPPSPVSRRPRTVDEPPPAAGDRAEESGLLGHPVAGGEGTTLTASGRLRLVPSTLLTD